MKVDVEGFELEVLQGCTRALAKHRIGLIQLAGNAMSGQVLGTGRQPVADLLAWYGYRQFRPDPAGQLGPVSDLGFGSDVFRGNAFNAVTRSCPEQAPCASGITRCSAAPRRAGPR